MRPPLLPASCFVLLLTGFPLIGLAAAQDPAPLVYGPGRQIATLADKRVRESSGLACSRRTPGVFWTHNDSGDEPVLYAFDHTGRHLATLRVQEARARDWEDMASFRVGAEPFLLAADVGDNGSTRAYCTLYVVPEPVLDPAKPAATLTARPAQVIRFSYEHGPANCESVAVDPTTRTVLLATKQARGASRVYALPLPDAPTNEVAVARHVATVRLPITTAMDVSPDGRRAMILTYGDAYEFSRGSGETWAQAFANPPRRIAMPRRRQGESICYGHDGRTLYLTSESKKLPTPLFEVPVVEPRAAAPAAR
ncbi:MAG: hypothetical protein ISS72_03880 [Candidatus Brocadiae bacterium]|nr:hypothetical protein [Candidatus Brocadiia bacterium]